MRKVTGNVGCSWPAPTKSCPGRVSTLARMSTSTSDHAPLGCPCASTPAARCCKVTNWSRSPALRYTMPASAVDAPLIEQAVAVGTWQFGDAHTSRNGLAELVQRGHAHEDPRLHILGHRA